MKRQPQVGQLVAASLVVSVLVLGAPAALRAQNMPDPSLIHGKALPASELPAGTVTVRVVREAIGNDITGQQVRVAINGAPRVATTDDRGRAEFRDLPVGAEARAEATVDGESLVSDPFTVPTAGGLRVILIAGIARATERRKQEEAEGLAAPAVRGVVVLGGDTRVIAQFQDDNLHVFYVLDILNTARTRVDIGGPLIVDLPASASGVTLLDGSSKQAMVEGTRLTVTGPFSPGTTPVQLRYQVRYASSDLSIAQQWPVALQQWIVGVQKVGNLALASPQLEMPADRAMEDGSVFLVATGQPVQAGSTTTLQLTNLPIHSRLAPRMTVGLALALIGLGVWLSVSKRSGEAAARNVLLKRRETLLGKLEDLEQSRRSGTVSDERYLSRRQRLIADLEQIYGEIDESGIHPHGGGEGVAA